MSRNGGRRMTAKVVTAEIAFLVVFAVQSEAALPTTRVCGKAFEGYPGAATCPTGMTVVSVNFAVRPLMNVCLGSGLSHVGRGLSRDWSPIQGVARASG